MPAPTQNDTATTMQAYKNKLQAIAKTEQALVALEAATKHQGLNLPLVAAFKEYLTAEIALTFDAIENLKRDVPPAFVPPGLSKSK